jgi:hypothetical protein
VLAHLRNQPTKFLLAKIIEVRITPLGEDDYTIEPQKLPLPETHPFATLINPLYHAKKKEEERKLLLEEEDDVEMKEPEAPSAQVVVPASVMYQGVERRLTFDYYVHYVGHQRRNDRWCHESEIEIDE